MAAAQLPPPLPELPGLQPSSDAGNLPGTVRIPIAGAPGAGQLEFHRDAGLISLIVREAPLNAVLGVLAIEQGVNIVASEQITSRISVTLHQVAFEDALTSILSVAGYTWVRQRDIYLVTPINSPSAAGPQVQGRVLRVFPLDFIAAADVEKVVQGLLSPVGKSYISSIDPADKRKSRERLVVEDLPERIAQIEEYVFQVDQPPKQVHIEAHILQVELSDDSRHGVDLRALSQQAGLDVALRTQGFTTPAAGLPAVLLDVDGDDVGALLDILKQTEDAKTLAKSQVSVINGQEARIQIGKQLGYFVTTTTQTSTLQNVNFIDTGVVLNVTPVISADNQVLMTVKPEVSDGRINPDTGLPEEDTTEVQTTLLLPSGHGMVIGGLIKEVDITTQAKLPVLGDLWLVGKAFQRNLYTRVRTEIIIALIPRVMPVCDPEWQHRHDVQLERASTPLLHGPLNRYPRPWEPRLPDSVDNPRVFQPERARALMRNPWRSGPAMPDHYMPSHQDAEGFPPSLMPIESSAVAPLMSPIQSYPPAAPPIELPPPPRPAF